MKLKLTPPNKRKEAYGASSCAYASLALSTIYKHLATLSNPRILDLGQPNEQKVQYYSALSKKIYFEDLCSQSVLLHDAQKSATSPDKSECSALFDEQLHISAQGKFDLIMVWDLFNYLSSSELKNLCIQLEPLLEANTKIYALLWTKNQIPDRPLIFKPDPQQLIAFEAQSLQERAYNPIRKPVIAKELTSFRRVSSTLLKNGFEEYLFVPLETLKTNLCCEVINQNLDPLNQNECNLCREDQEVNSQTLLQ